MFDDYTTQVQVEEIFPFGWDDEDWEWEDDNSEQFE